MSSKSANTIVSKTASASAKDAALAQQYQRKTDKQHILDNPDTYIGSIENVDAHLWVWQDATGSISDSRAKVGGTVADDAMSEVSVNTVTESQGGTDAGGADTKKLVLRTLEYIPGLYKLFDEGIVNCRDHVIRMMQQHSAATSAQEAADKRCVTYINITIGEDGVIVLENDGNGIDVAKHPEYDIWIPEMIFGHLRTSTNYNKDEKRIVGGKNGFGFKLVLIWSEWGKVETVDHVRGLKYTQEFKKNLDEICAPVIKPAGKSAKPFTRVTFKPDYARLGLAGTNTEGGLTHDMLCLLKKRVYDIAAVTDHGAKKIKITLNGEVVPVKNFQQYIDLYIGSKGQAKRVYESGPGGGERWEYAVALSPTHQFEQVSFVNGICTFKGGKHVDYILGQITRKLAAYIEKKKKVVVNPNTIKEQLFLFLRADIENPAFDSQTKDYMNTPSAKFGSTCTVSDAFVEKIAKMGVMDAACQLSDLKERSAAAKRTDGTKTRTIRGIANFIDANYAGTPQSKECILILCEGLSAMSGVVSGLSSEDRNRYGIYPLKGKLLNVRGEGIKRIAENKEITDLKRILGLETDRVYATQEDVWQHLRYGKVMFMTDSDVDGSHIKGLCVNLFQSEWTSLFQQSGFLSFMNTPILRAKRGQQTLVFYHEGEYETWKQGLVGGSTTGWTMKYFKGLGTSTAVEFKEYFANKKIVDFAYQGPSSDQIVDKIFNKKRADERKTWLEEYEKSSYLDTTLPTVSYEAFVDRELRHFSIYDCERSIPNLVDGLKTSLRKILYSSFKRRLTSEVKVAQFSGYVSEHSAYHHGEHSLNMSIIGMAQNFVGANNIHLLEPHGQFGCLAPDTPVLMWNGDTITANKVVVGDKLVGDDGQPRTVLKTTNGVDDMFEITMKNSKSATVKSFTVNSQHILTVLYSKHLKITWKESTKTWCMSYYNNSTGGILYKCISTTDLTTLTSCHFNKSTLSKDEAYNQMSEFRDKYIEKNGSSQVIDIKVNDYLKVAKSQQRHIFMISNTCAIQWKTQCVPIDPYIFGVWLGDGDHNGHGFTNIDDEVVRSVALWADTINAEITHHNNSGRDDCYHYGIRRKTSGKVVAIGDATNSSATCIACQHSKMKHPSCDWVFEKSAPTTNYGVTSAGETRTDLNPFKEILKKNKLYKNKDIPTEYIYNDENTRLQILAGFIDTDGTLRFKDTTSARFEICQSDRLHGNLIDKINTIALSLGFATSVSYSNTNKNKMKTLFIYGNDLYRIPTRIERKQTAHVQPYRRNHTMHYTQFSVTPVGKGEFYGWSIDGNERFLLGDFTITHNSRLQGGDDAASERYIYTQLNPLTRYVFREADDAVLTYRKDDGQSIEPEYYVPILPMVLINGVSGIGTGFSSSIPPFHPMKLVEYLRARLDDSASAPSVPLPLTPYYENFKGTVMPVPGESHKYLIKGVYRVLETMADTIQICELPVGTWTMPYIAVLESLADGGVDKKGKKIAPAIKDFVSNSTEKLVDIRVTFPKGKLAELEAQMDTGSGAGSGINGVEKLLKLTTTVSTTNMHLFDAECKLQKYATIEAIIDAFVGVRLGYYDTRKQHQLRDMELVLKKLTNKVKYIQLVLDGTVDLRRKSAVQIEALLVGHGLERWKGTNAGTSGSLDKSGEDDGESTESGTYDYLVRMPMISVSSENVDKLLKEKADLETKWATLNGTTVQQLWLTELTEFEHEYHGFVRKWGSEYADNGKGSDGKAAKSGVKKGRVVVKK